MLKEQKNITTVIFTDLFSLPRQALATSDQTNAKQQLLISLNETVLELEDIAGKAGKAGQISLRLE